MLIKRKDFMTPKFGAVKKSGFKLLLVTLLTAAAYAPNSFAGDSIWVDRVISAKFSMAELKSEDGLKKVYAKLEKKAARACRSERSTRYHTGESMAECTADLMDQFVESAKIESLQDYHLTAKTTAA